MQLSSFVKDNAAGNLYNIVGFQTHPKWGSKNDVFKWFQVLKMLSLSVMGSCNSYMDSPNLLESKPYRSKPATFFFAGRWQVWKDMLVASGSVAGINAARLFKGESEAIFPEPQRSEV